MRSLRFILFLTFLSVLFNLSSHACDVENDDFYKKYPTLKPLADDPWQNRLFTELPKAVLKQLYERSKKKFASKKDFLSAVQMTGSQQQVQVGDFIYDNRILIGEGEEGRVHLARHIPTGCYTAVKTPVRKSECEAFKNLGRCYAHFTSDSRDYLFTPFIMGTPLSQYYFDEKRLGVRVDSQNKVSYSNWPHNLRLLDAFLVELERGIHYEETPRELDSKSMFVIDEFSEEPKVVFVDLEEGGYTPKGLDYIPDEFCVSMFLLLGSQGSTRMRELVFPQPIQDFFDKASNGDGFHVRLTDTKKARNQLMKEMQELGCPGTSVGSGQASSSSQSSYK